MSKYPFGGPIIIRSEDRTLACVSWNKHTMDQCLFAAKEDRLIAICKANGKTIFSSSFRRVFAPAWQGERQEDTRRGDNGRTNQRTSGVRQTLLRGSSLDNASAPTLSTPNEYTVKITGCCRCDVRKSQWQYLGAQDRISLRNYEKVVVRSQKLGRRKRSRLAMCGTFGIKDGTRRARRYATATIPPTSESSRLYGKSDSRC